jgi:hypothetical protein
MTLNARLIRIFPALRGTDFAVETSELGGNAWNTVSVLRHRIVPADGSAPLECVEKRLTKVLGIGPFEPLLQAWVSVLDAGRRLIRTAPLGVVETPLACYVYSEVVTGPHPNLGRIAAHAASGIAQMERASADLVRSLPAFTRRRMDFFGPWSLWRPRYNVALALRRPILRRTPALDGVLQLALQLQPHVRRLAGSAQRSPCCFSHLDLLSKNIIETREGLHLIDWGEARIGRVGFDAGSYLHRLFRGNELSTFEQSRAVFMDSYLAHLPPDLDPRQVRRNALYFLTLRTLCFFLRPDVLRANAATPEVIERKLAWLLTAVEQDAVAG